MSADRIDVSRDGRSTLNRSPWPLIIVPGLMGSRLEAVTGDRKIWDPDSSTFMVGLMMRSPDALADLFTPEVTPGQPIRTPDPRRYRKKEFVDRGWGGPAWGFYGRGIEELQKWLRGEGAVVYCFPYDWRSSNLESGAALGKLIQDIKRETVDGSRRFRLKPIIVTHSNGGLVTRAACRASDAESHVAAVLHTFMPTYGTPEAYTKFKLGEDTFALGKIIGSTHEEIAVVGGGVKVMGQLLPNQIYPRGAQPWLTWDRELEAELNPPGPYVLSDPYKLYKETSGRLGLVNHETFNANAILIRNAVWATNTRSRLRRLLDNIDEAKRFHSATEGVRDYIHPYTYLISGTGLETSVAARQHRVQETFDGIPLTPTARTERVMGPGDKTVAEVAGRVFEPRCRASVVLSGVEHAEAFNDGIVITAMLALIRQARLDVPIEQQRWA